MNRVTKAVAAGLALSMLVIGCKKKEEQPIPQTPMQAPMGATGQGMMPGQGAPHSEGPKVDKTVVVPENVKNTWKKVKLVLLDKTSNKSNEYAINVHSEFSVPNSKLKIVVGEFLPDFKMDQSSFTSVSNEPNQPAVRVEVYDDGKVVFKGWLFSKLPAIHPFEHPKYGLTLKEGIKG